MYKYEKIKSRIVWISDIHFRKEYAQDNEGKIDEKLTPFFESFLNILKKELETGAIDYFFLTGDIGFSGSIEDYQAFWGRFIKELYSFFSKEKSSQPFIPKIITIPGNHDFDRTDINPFEKFLTDYTSKQTTLDQQYEVFTETEFCKLFKNYSEFFSKEEKHRDGEKEIWNAFFKLDQAYKYANVYTDHRLFGYHVDEQKQLILVLLNSAWFSIGNKFNELLADSSNLKSIDFKKEEKELLEEIKKHTKVILDMKDRVTEYGNQIIGRDLFPTPNLIKTINENPEYIVITCMHHPQNWLSWGEVYDFKEDGEKAKDFALNKILSQTDILLTGHEHVPIIKKPESIDSLEGKRWHLKAGMFMEDQINVLQSNDYFEHSRFSVIDIDGNKYHFEERKYLYKRSKKHWVLFEEKPEKYPLNQKSRLMTQERKEEIQLHLPDFDIQKFFKARYEGKNYNFEKQESNEEYQVYRINNTSCSDIRYCILPLTADFLNKYFLPDNFINHFVDDLIALPDNAGKIVAIHFLWPDILIKDDLFSEYITPPKGKGFEFVFEKISRYSATLFNKFRHLYFSRFEMSENSEKSSSGSIPSIEFQKVMNVRFTNEPLPFWTVKHYCQKITEN